MCFLWIGPSLKFHCNWLISRKSFSFVPPSSQLLEQWKNGLILLASYCQSQGILECVVAKVLPSYLNYLLRNFRVRLVLYSLKIKEIKSRLWPDTPKFRVSIHMAANSRRSVAIQSRDTAWWVHLRLSSRQWIFCLSPCGILMRVMGVSLTAVFFFF